MSTAPSSPEQREYFRVKTELPLRIRPVSQAERQPLEFSILSREAAGPGELDPQLAAWLDRIESKLDHLLLHFGLDFQEIRPTERVSIVLSGSGLALPREHVDANHSLFLLELELPGPPAHAVRLLAEKVARRDSGELVAMRFCAIQPEDREAVVRHTLDVQRTELRQRAAGRVDP